jgi:hypothetical protein
MATERREADFYPTPPCAVEALRLWFVQKFGAAPLQERWLDPAAGAGSLLHWFGVPHARRYALEFREGPKVEADLARFVASARTVTGVNSLDVSWGHVINVIANPPFTMLTPFMERMDREQAARGGFTISMTPTQWWQAQSRKHIRRPHYFLPLCWRPAFMGAGGAQYDVAWSVWAPEAPPATETAWLTQTDMPRKGANRHPAWDVFQELQP